MELSRARSASKTSATDPPAAGWAPRVLASAIPARYIGGVGKGRLGLGRPKSFWKRKLCSVLRHEFPRRTVDAIGVGCSSGRSRQSAAPSGHPAPEPYHARHIRHPSKALLARPPDRPDRAYRYLGLPQFLRLHPDYSGGAVHRGALRRPARCRALCVIDRRGLRHLHLPRGTGARGVERPLRASAGAACFRSAARPSAIWSSASAAHSGYCFSAA